MNREQYSELSITALKDLAKDRGLKGLSIARKNEIIDALIENDNQKLVQDKSRTYNNSNNKPQFKMDRVTLENTMKLHNKYFVPYPGMETIEDLESLKAGK